MLHRELDLAAAPFGVDRLSSATDDRATPVVSEHLPGSSDVTLQLVHLDERHWADLDGSELIVCSRVGGSMRVVQRLSGLYPGRMVALAHDVLAFAGDEAPWVFLRWDGRRLNIIGEIRPQTLRIFDHFVAGGRHCLVGRGAGDTVEVVQPLYDSKEDRDPAVHGVFSFESAWLGVFGFPATIDQWMGTRKYQDAVAGVLANEGVCSVVTPPSQSYPAIGLVVWFREEQRTAFVLVIPASSLSTLDRDQLVSLDGTHAESDEETRAIQRTIEPFWGFAVAAIHDDDCGGIASGPITGHVHTVVRLRTR